MKKFNVTVNGKSYEVVVEEVGGAAVSAPVAVAAPAPVAKAAPAPVAAAPAPAPVATPAAPAAPVAAGAGTITAPMSGTIFKSLVKVGDTVKNGQAVIVLEAMKMENEIFAPCDGTVKEVKFAEGAAVSPGDVLVVIG